MSGVKERLSRLKRSSSSSMDTEANRETDVSTQLPSHTAAPDKITELTTSLHAGWDKLGVQLVTNSHGAFLLRERRYSNEFAHGLHRVGELIHRMSFFRTIVNSTDPALSEAAGDSESLLFLDTETTGLGVGAGNVAFMIGLGYYEAGDLVVQQLFIRNPAEELAMLVYLRTLMETRNRLVTYNGKCFDWPIIKNRFVMNRLRSSGEEPQHFDLLYPSRGLWRRSLPSCRLSIVEKARLGLTRIDDVPGSLAPELYFLYLAEGNPTVLSGVFEHNEKDILTLAALAVHFSKLLEGVIPLESLEDEELYRFGMWMDKLGLEHRSVEAIQLLMSRPSVMNSEHALLCAAFYKRRHSYEIAVPIWRQLVMQQIGRGGLALLEPCIELAMYYEHREKNIAEALEMAEQALSIIRGRRTITRNDPKHKVVLEQVQQRITRLRGKASAINPERSPSSNRLRPEILEGFVNRKQNSRKQSPSYVMESLL